MGSKNSTPDNFLPYPGITSENGEKAFSVPTDSTIRRLIENGGLPYMAVADFKLLLKGG